MNWILRFMNFILRMNELMLTHHELQINLHEGYNGHAIRRPLFIFGVPYIHLIRHLRWHLSRCDSVTDWLWQFTGLSFTTNPPLCYLKEKAMSRPTKPIMYHIFKKAYKKDKSHIKRYINPLIPLENWLFLCCQFRYISCWLWLTVGELSSYIYFISCSKLSKSSVEKNSPKVISNPSQNFFMVLMDTSLLDSSIIL